MKKSCPLWIRKGIGCIALAGCTLCSSTIPVYAAFPVHDMVSPMSAVRSPEPGEYFYRQLNDTEKAIYDSIVSQIEKLTTDSFDPSGVTVTVPNDFSMSSRTIFAVFRDHPEFFWVNASELVWAEKENDGSNSTYSLALKSSQDPFFYDGFTPGDLQSYRNDLDAKVANILANMPSTATDTVSKLRYLNDWMASNNVYNTLGVGASNFSRCAASGLLSDNNGTTTGDDPVCYGYATAMKVLLDACDIENAYIEGWARNGNNGNGEQHAWNYVKLDDGNGTEQWYALDPTWDDPGIANLPAREVYFLVGSNTVTNEGAVGLETFGENHDPTNSPALQTPNKFSYPTLAIEERDPSADGNVSLQKPDGQTAAYDTLEAAMQDAESGDTLILQNTVSLSNTLILKDGVTLDLNGTGEAITSTASPVLRTESGSSATIINSGTFSTINLTSDSTTVVENQGSLTLGGNVQFVSSTTPLVGILSGNAPQKAPHVRYVSSGKFATAYLVAEPTPPSNGSFSAQSGDTVQTLIDAFQEPAVSIQFYLNNGSLANVPNNEYTLQWDLKQSPNGGNRIDPGAPLENGIYRFEATAFDYVIPYEIEVTGIPAATQEISSVTLTGLDAPIADQTLDTTVTVGTPGITSSAVSWTPNDSTAEYDTVYTATIALTADPGYTFASSVSATINGQAAEVGTMQDDTLSVSMEFPATSAQTIYLQSITQPQPITAPNGTALDDLSLPTQVDIQTSDGQTRKATVNWTLAPVDGTSYQPALTTEQNFKLEGTVELPDGIDANGHSLTVEIDVTVAAASVVAQVAAPTASPAPGHYQSNQTVTLTSTTPGAVIYYTLDGSEPSATNGIRYTNPIAVNGTAGNTVTICIKAIAVADSLNDSTVVTLEYEIALPGNTGGGSSSGGGTSSGGSSVSSGSSSSSNRPQTTTNPDGSTTTTVTKPDGSITETTKYPDGSTQIVDTKKDGTVTTTTTDATGNKTTVTEKTDGTTETTVNQKDGSSSTTVVKENGKLEAEITLPAGVVNDATEKGQTVSLPMPAVSATSDTMLAPSIAVSLPSPASTVKVEIPVKNVTSGTVAVLVKADGTEEIIKTSVVTETGIIAKVTDGSTIKIMDNSKYFDDVPSIYWGADAINFTVSRELFSGTGPTTFQPNIAMTRSMITTVLARLDGVDTSTGNNWYDAGREWAIANGISDGTNMEQPLTREQLATMLWRYAGKPSASANFSSYTDASTVSDYAVQAMAWAIDRGIISGTTTTTLSPQEDANRAQVATMLMRFIAQNT